MDFLTFDHQFPDADRQPESLWAGAARIEIEHAGAYFLVGNVTVTINYSFESRSLRLQVQLGEVMQNVDRRAREFDYFVLGQPASPRRFIDVPANGSESCKCAESLQDFGITHIPRVNDVFRSAQCVQRFRTKQAVGVGDDADNDESSQLPVPGCRLALIN